MIYVFHRDAQKDIPLWIEFLAFEVLAKLLRVSLAHKEPTASPGDKTDYQSVFKTCQKRNEESKVTCCSHKLPNNNDFTCAVSKSQEDIIWRSCVERKIKLLSGKIEDLEHKLSNDLALQKRKLKWHQLAHVLDSFFFWIFVVSLIVSTVTFSLLIPSPLR